MKSVNSNFFKKSEYGGLQKLYKQSPRSRFQVNSFNSADAEILSGRKCPYLAISTDSIAIEIHSGLYKSPETWGYMAAVNSISDLSASGAWPLGILLSSQWEKSHQKRVRDQVLSSFSKTLRKFKVPLLGGDSGSSEQTILTTTILGESKFPPLTRLGVRRNDLILVFGDSFGYGPTLAHSFLFSKTAKYWEARFRPRPDWKMINTFRKYFRASIDSSDGVYNALDTLALLNKIQFEVNLDQISLPNEIQKYSKKNNLPKEYFLESDLGDLQTCVAIDPKTYSKIKSRLPFHQVFAIAKKAQKRTVIYTNKKSINPLPEILEKVNMNYTKGFKLWRSQFP